MRAPYLILTLLALIALAPCPNAAAQQPGAKPRVVRTIRFSGNRRYSDDFLKHQIATKEGEQYDPGLLHRDERHLREFFSAVLSVETIPVTKDGEPTGEVDIFFHVEDRLVVGRVTFEGLLNVKKEDFQETLHTRPGRPLLDYALRRDAELIARLHREVGYHFVEVRALPKRTGKQDVNDVVFRVIPNKRVRVREVVFEGARSVKRSQLQKIIQNSDRYRTQYFGLGNILNPTFFQEDLLKEDRRRLEFYYRQEGWMDANVALVRYRFDDENSKVIIHYRIDEGQRYRIRSYSVKYEEGGLPLEKDRADLTPETLERLSVYAPGYAFRAEDLERTRMNLRERLWEHAYAKSRIETDVRMNPLDRSVDITYRIVSGPKVRMGELRPLGNRWTRDNVIRRQFRDGALPGEELNVEELRAGRTRLQQLRFFNMVRFGTGANSDPWGLVKSGNEDRPDEYDVEVELEEGDTRNIGFGIGVSTDGGVSGFVTVTWNNFDYAKPPTPWWQVLNAGAFRGGGQKFVLSVAPGEVFSQFTVAYSDPAVNDSRWGISVKASRELAAYSEYDQSTDGIYVTLSRFLDEAYRWRLAFDWSLRQVTLDDPEPDAPVNMLDQQGRSLVHSVGASISYMRVRESDPFLNGYRTALTAHLEGGPLGADVDVWNLEWDGSLGFRTYRTRQGLWQRIRFHLGADYAQAFDDTPEVPIFDRYFLGGRNLRGFEFREVGPKSNGSPMGGEFRGTFITQYTFPITDRDVTGFGIDLHLFVDQGTLVEDVGDISWDRWRVSGGFGFGIQFGAPNQPPLTIDFGWPLQRVPGDITQVVSVSFERKF